MGNPDAQIVIVFVLGASVLIFGGLFLRERRRMQAIERYKNHRCANCGYDLRASDKICPECACPIGPPELPMSMPLDPRALQSHWPTESTKPRTPGSEEGLVDLYNSGEISAVDMLIEQLHARGIPTSERGVSIASDVANYTGSGPRQYKTVSVWSGDLDRAIEIVRGFTRAEQEYQKKIHAANPERPL